MATKNLVPRGSGEGGIGVSSKPWGDAYFDSGHFNKGLYVSGVAVSTGDVGGLGGKWDDGTTAGDIYYNDGKVGIGNAGPEAILDVARLDQNETQPALKVSRGDTSTSDRPTAPIFNVFNGKAGGTEVFRVQGNGNVGIGTTSPPVQNLCVQDANHGGSIGIGSDSGENKYQYINFARNWQLGKKDSSNNTVGESGAFYLQNLDASLNGQGITYFTVLTNGNVGIGTTSPSARLDIAGGINFSGNIVPATNDAFDIGSADKKVRDLYLGSNSLHIGGGTISSNNDERIQFHTSGILIGEALLIPDPSDPSSLYFPKVPQVEDAEGNPVSLLSADKLGLGTSEITETDPGDIKFKLLTDENRFVVGTTGEGNLQSGWYRFNDFKVKGANDIGAHSTNPVDTRIYSDESSFIVFKNDVVGRKVAHLVGGEEEVSANNALALGISIKTDSSESPEDIEFTHTDGESYSLINGDSDSVGSNGLPLRQGFQPASIGANPSPLLIDGGSF